MSGFAAGFGEPLIPARLGSRAGGGTQAAWAPVVGVSSGL